MSSVGLVEGLSAREMVEVFDAMRAEGPLGGTTQEMLERMKLLRGEAGTEEEGS